MLSCYSCVCVLVVLGWERPLGLNKDTRLGNVCGTRGRDIEAGELLRRLCYMAPRLLYESV